MQLQLSKSTAYGVPETPPVDTARADRFRAAIGNVFWQILQNTRVVTNRKDVQKDEVLIDKADFTTMRKSSQEAYEAVSSGSADDFMKNGLKKFNAVQMLDNHSRTLNAVILYGLKADLQRKKVNALKQIYTGIQKIFDDFKAQKQTPSSIELPRFALVLQGDPNVIVARDMTPHSSPSKNKKGDTSDSASSSSNASSDHSSNKNQTNRLFEDSLKPRHGIDVRGKAGGSTPVIVPEKTPHPTDNPYPEDPRKNPSAVFGLQPR